MANALQKAMTLVAGFGLSGSLARAEDNYRGYESPPYTVEAQVGAAELRSYVPHILAEVTVRGSQGQALGRGFQVLANYIFGGNQAAAEVAMTSPVVQRPAVEIAMTAPVAQSGSGDLWTVAFSMPRQWTLETLPVPGNDAIRFVQTAPERQLVLTFSGRAGAAVLDARAAELVALAEGAGLTLTAGPFYYFYDDPFTLPWNRRNEVAFRVEQAP